MGVATAAIGGLGLLGGLAGSIVNAGAQEQAQAASEAAAYQAQVAQNNAAIAQQNARLDIQAGETQAANQGLKTRAAVGTAARRQRERKELVGFTDGARESVQDWRDLLLDLRGGVL